MREILFRGKTKSGRWIEGNYVKLIEDGREYHYIMPVNDDPELIAVRPETIGQYTGVLDFHSNKIFEGDKVEFASHLDSRDYTGEVVYNTKQGCFEVKANDGFETPLDYDDLIAWLVVEGNIHDQKDEQDQ